MSKQHDRITEKFSKFGIAWAVRSDKFCSPDDPLEAQANGTKTYHVHPDASHPHVNDILRFSSLVAIEEWLNEIEILAIAQAARDKLMGDARTEMREYNA